MPNLRNGTKGDSNPGSLDCESGILPLIYRAPYKVLRHAFLGVTMSAPTFFPNLLWVIYWIKCCSMWLYSKYTATKTACCIGWLSVSLLCRLYCSNAIVSLNCYTAFVPKCWRRIAEGHVMSMNFVTGLALAEKPTFHNVFTMLTVNRTVSR